jgi:hypothetical protein
MIKLTVWKPIPRIPKLFGDIAMRPHANIDAATQYKAQADAVLLSRGKKPAVRLSIKGKSESQISDMLTALQNEVRLANHECHL